jgi:xanthine dehydrogenase/oxidase
MCFVQTLAGREGWIADYEVGFSADGTITALKYHFYIDAGIDQGDTSGSVWMGMTWADNAYYFPNYCADATICYTNTPGRTSMRCPGVVQTSFCTELVVERVAVELGLSITAVQQRNFISDGKMAVCGQVITDCTLPTVWSTMLQRSRYDSRLNLIAQYNARNLWRKRGISVCPVKYGMGWNGYNAGVKVGVNQADGTVNISHSGCEIGQGINTKAAQAVAMALGIDIKLIRVGSTDTDRITNGGCTGGSGTSEVIVQAALNACQVLNDRLAPYRESSGFGAHRQRKGAHSASSSSSTADWVALLSTLPYDVSLNAEGWYSPNENPNGQVFQYFVYAACVTEVELDVLSGEVHVLASEIVYDCGQSLNPAVDIGQIEGALVAALGYFLTERVEYDADNGQLLTNGTWEYKPPLSQDIPAVMNVTLLRNKYNESGILGSKAVGEPPFVIANSVYFALKMAIASARADAGAGAGFFPMEVPATIDVRQQASLVTPSRFYMPY